MKPRGVSGTEITGSETLFDHERSRVPPNHSRNWISLSAVFLGICVGIPPMVLGSNLAAGMGFRAAASAVVWSSLIAMPICVLASHVGTRTRLSTGMTLRFAFGTSGARIISAIISFDMFCWAAMNMEIFAGSLQSRNTSDWILHIPRAPATIAVGVLMIVTTIFGYRSMEKFAFLMVPSLLGVVAAYFVYVLHSTSFREVTERPAFGTPIQYATAVSAIVGSYLNLSILLPDTTRYSKGASHSATSVVLGLCVGLPLFVLVACYLSAAAREPDFVRLMTLQGWGAVVILVVAITCWFHMNSCLYSASLNLAAIFKQIPKWELTVAGGIASTAVALFGIVGRYVHFLELLSVLVPPIAGVYTADYLARRKLYEFGSSDQIEPYRASAVIALFVGILIGVATSGRKDIGLGLFHLSHLPAIDSYLSSFACQLVLCRLLSSGMQQPAENSSTEYESFSSCKDVER
jgi:cytosine permease